MEDLKARNTQLEEELKSAKVEIEGWKIRYAQIEEDFRLEKAKNGTSTTIRPKINEMSSEVVDSNPYR